MDGAGDQFLAGPGFAGNEDVRFACGDLQSEVVYFPEPAAPEDDGPGRIRQAQFLLERSIFLDEQLPLQRLFQYPQDILPGKRLGYIIVGAEFYGVNGGIYRAESRHDDDRQLRSQFLDLLQYLYSVH